MDIILKAVCEFYKIPEDIIFRETRKGKIVYARQVFHYISYKAMNENKKTTLKDIQYFILTKKNKFIGLSSKNQKVINHATILHAAKKIENDASIYWQTRLDLQEIIQKIKEYKESQEEKKLQDKKNRESRFWIPKSIDLLMIAEINTFIYSK